MLWKYGCREGWMEIVYHHITTELQVSSLHIINEVLKRVQKKQRSWASTEKESELNLFLEANFGWRTGRYRREREMRNASRGLSDRQRRGF